MDAHAFLDELLQHRVFSVGRVIFVSVHLTITKFCFTVLFLMEPLEKFNAFYLALIRNFLKNNDERNLVVELRHQTGIARVVAISEQRESSSVAHFCPIVQQFNARSS